MKPDNTTDVVMVTYNRPHYTELSLRALLEHSDPSTRIWLWHNGDDEATLAVVRQYRQDLYRCFHSRTNAGLVAPTNWLFTNATGQYLGKVDDDCIVPLDWTIRLRAAHAAEPRLGVLGSWRFQSEDFLPDLAASKIVSLNGDVRVLMNMWVEGSGYLMKRACFDRLGPLSERSSFTDYCIRVGRHGWINGWLYPFIYQEHMDDPRSPHSALHSDEDLQQHMPLSARRTGVTRLEDWVGQLQASARLVQTAPVDPTYWSPLRRRLRGLVARWKAHFGT